VFNAFRLLARNRQLRRLMVASAAFHTGDISYFALIVVFTYTAGGVPAVGAATALNVLPGGLLGPLAATLATSRRPQLHLAIGIGLRGLMMIGTIVVVLTGASVNVVLALVTVDSIMSAAVWPLHGALAVRVADSAAEQAAANAATSSIVSAGELAGPALAGLALGVFGIGWAFAVPASVFAAGTAASVLIRVPRADDEPSTTRVDHSDGAMRSQLRAISSGFRGIIESRPATAAAVLLVVNTTVVGVWEVASAAVATERLGLGQGSITLIMTLTGAGGLLGALATLSIVGRRGLASILASTMVGLAVTLAAITVIIVAAPTLALAAVMGATGAVAYAIAPTLVQRSVQSDAMVPAAAGLQSAYLIAYAAGAIVGPLLIATAGLTTALLTSAVAVLITLVTWPQLRRADALSPEDTAKLAVLQTTPSLAPLHALALEQLAHVAVQLTIAAGSDVVRQGDHGDRFYVIAAGLADVTVDGHRVGTLGAGGSFGEIALLHDVARSATVTAREDLTLVAVDRREFLAALSSDTPSVNRIRGLARTRLATRPAARQLVELDRDAALGGRSVAEMLSRQPPLAGIDAAALGALAESARVLAAPDGTWITREGDYGSTFYVIVNGAARVFEGEKAVAVLRPGDGFGEQAILRDVPITATVQAVGDTTLVAVDREMVQRARQAGGSPRRHDRR
jgi:CRP-like cAMP-binding protein/predicted MFS family arabinose efflux permease